MKAKNSLRGLLWPLIKQYSKLKYRRRLLCGWRKDDERYSSKNHSSAYHRQSLICDESPEIMKGILNVFFKADHYSAQFEQYRLENDGSQPIVLRKPATHLMAFVNSGLRVLITVIIIMGADSARLNAQNLKAPQTLNIGDKVPDVTIQIIINYTSKSAKISDFKGKLLILDFWATWCGSCFKKMPLLDSLQNANSEKLQVLLVNAKTTGDTEQKISAFYGKRQNAARFGNKLPSIVQDSILKSMFPHSSVPYYVWIGADSRVIATTSAAGITTGNILSILRGGTAEFSKTMHTGNKRSANQ